MSDKIPDPIQVTLKVTQAFEQLGINYLVGGSLASAIYGVGRGTLDSDIVAEIKPEQIQPLVEALKAEFYIDPEMIRDAIQHNSSFNLLHLETMFKVDVFIIKHRAFDHNQMQRRVLQMVGDLPAEHAYFSTAEDIILAKLEWFRAGGGVSDRQWQDILGVISLQAERLDFEYLQTWAKTLGVQELLQKAIKESPS
jgi:hypothetical protein